MGVGVKKENTGAVMYRTLCGRKYPTSEIEIALLKAQSLNVLQKVREFINENKRKGNR